MASIEVTQQPIKHKTCVLRVSIHCEGCKRKVKKLFQSLPGVDEIEINRLHQRVVVTGDISSLWPENPPEINLSEKHSQKNEKQPSSSQRNASEESAVAGKEIKPLPSKTDIPAENPVKSVSSTVAGGKDPVTNEDGKVNKSEKLAEEVKDEENKLPATGPAGKQDSPAVVEKKGKQIEQNDVVIIFGEEKKNKKGQNGNKTTTNGIGETSSAPQSVNQQAHPQISSYTMSYYAPPQQPQAYAYSHYGSEMSQTNVNGDSFEMFSDENPNGCLVM
ncbi:heavy metal-associated isoprenylated plant protein 35-like [Rutidosis leptorrhynchoides]|uniref:heavy metal-associated isoprenylated plant protein 35-like n=1 Tax=Rutidosis leptorrhynchoides TaxID=125765 RepID=UPI003A997C21